MKSDVNPEVKAHGDRAVELLKDGHTAAAVYVLNEGLKKVRDTRDIAYLIFSGKPQLELMCRVEEKGEWLLVEQFHLHDDMLQFKCEWSDEWHECPLGEFWQEATFR